jgi:glycosyltransferase involved in cell wall biosynthesis
MEVKNQGMAGRVLLLTDSISKHASGGVVARHVIKRLQAIGVAVSVLDYYTEDCADQTEALGVQYFRNRECERLFRTHRVTGGGPIDWLERLLSAVNPDVIHFCAWNSAKSLRIGRLAKEMGVGLVGQLFTYGVFCAQGYAYLPGEGECFRCAAGAFPTAARHGCISGWKTILTHAIRKAQFRVLASKIDAFLSTCASMDEILHAYGVAPERIVRASLPFDRSRIAGMQAEEGTEFVFHGQLLDFKGGHLLAEIARRCPDTRFAFYPINLPKCGLEGYGLGSNCPGNIRIVLGKGWCDGVGQAVAFSRGVLVPSLWPTTTEHATYEAMAFSKPVVVFNVGAYRDFLRHKENAMVVTPGDVEEYAAAIRMLDEKPGLRNRIGRAALVTFEERTADEPLTRALSDAYALARPEHSSA